MLYGFISKLDDETTKVIFRNKKIPSENVYHIIKQKNCENIEYQVH